MFAVLNSNAQQFTADTQASKMEWLGEKVTGEHKGTIDLKSGTLEMKNNKIVRKLKTDISFSPT